METIDLVFSFDTTGSMAPCIARVRRCVEDTVKVLFEEIPNIRIGVLTHGDYCDGNKVITSLDLSTNKNEICKFIRSAPATSGGDADECYELVLNEVRQFQWTKGRNKALVLIGDANPHEVGYRYGGKVNKLDWRNELGLLLEAGITVYPVQALGRRDSNNFYDEIANTSNVPKLELNQFDDINDLILAVCLKRANKLDRFNDVLHSQRRRASHNILNTIDSLNTGKKKNRKLSKEAVHPSRFQIMYVDRDCAIKDFVEENDLTFKQGRGFYELTKRVTIQDYKEVIAENIKTGEMFSGNAARKVLGLPIGKTEKVSPMTVPNYRGFVQSTSVNRKLLEGTRFLYEVEDF